ncbi:MAG: hypothetical protein K0Q55_1123, partial [Verrucomicrobia bacterium]|jgi:hypothetical protein|nr:hypothetical protein [Verrucomicrobiota bacterium]
VPINQLKYRLLWPESRRLYLKKHLTTVEPTESKQNGLVEYSWDVNADQPLSLEDSLPLSYDPYPWVQLSEYADWSEVKDWALKLYQIPTEQSPEIIALTSAWQKSLPTAEERLLAVIQFVQDEVRYLGIEIGANTHRPTPPSVVLTRRFGDCKDKSLLLCALLRALGFEAYPALVSTGDRESIKDRHASPYVFNHVVVQLKHDGKEWWVDATSSGQRGKLEHRFFPAYGYALILRPDTKGLEPINTGTNGWPKTIITEKLLLRGKKESADLTIITRAEGVEAESLRDTLKSVRREELEKDYLNYYAKTYPKITQVKPMESTDDLTKNVVITTEHYRIDEAWEYSEKDKKHACEFYPQSLSSLLETPQTRLRSMPLGIDFPMHHVVRMEVQLPEPWPVETNHFSLHGHALHFEAHRTYGDNRLVMEYELRTLTNSIPAQLVAAHVKQVGEIEDHLGYSIFWGEENNTETKPVASFSPNWTIIFITILYGIILAAAIAWFFLKRKITPPPLPDAELLPYASTLTGIGGWLFLVAFGLIVNPFRMVSSITETFPAYTPESWSHLTLPGSEGYDWRWAPYLIISLLANETIVIWTLVNLILFFRRDRLFPISYICFMIATAVLVTLDQMMASQMPSAEKTTPEEMKELVRGYMLCFIWVPYFLRSKRVRLTFTN